MQMLTVAAPHLIIDLPTLLAVMAFFSLTGGLLLLFGFAQNRKTPALALWGVGYLLGAAAAAALAFSLDLPEAWSAGIANTLMCTSYGMMWGGARSFEGRRVHPWMIAAGPAIWIAAIQVEAFAQSAQARIALVSAITATYALLGARELWHARDRELFSRWPTLTLVIMHAGFLLARIPFAQTIAASAAAGQVHGFVAAIIAFQALFTTFCLPFLRFAMAKERAELEQRKAALTDSLTGIANRRAFLDGGSQLLEWAFADRRPIALLLFDLDGFKEINDTAGHQAGDRVLLAFCELVAASVRSGDLFGRLGGDEFACLLTGASIAQALHMAEHLRREFALLSLPDLAAKPTVSVGVAMASEAGRNLPALLAIADRALYRAKADGRNRVARAPLVLVNTPSDQRVLAAGEASRLALADAARS
jgi:diguanylate cyclase (GGDEF)-like protein